MEKHDSKSTLPLESSVLGVPGFRVAEPARQHVPVTGKRRLLALLLAVLSIAFVYVLSRNARAAETLELGLLLDGKTLLVLPGLSALYILAKSISLFLCVRWAGGTESLFACFKIFCQSVFMEITLFPSKPAGDAYKYGVLRSLAGRDRLLAIGLFRAGPVLVLTLIGIVVLAGSRPLLAVVLLACLPVLALGCRRRAGRILRQPLSRIAESGGRRALRNLPLLVFLSLLSTLVWSVQAFWIAGLVSGKTIPFWSFLAAFLLANALGALSSLPFGLGVKDASLGLYLRAFLSAQELVIALLLMRLFGELSTGLAGWVLFVGDLVRKRARPQTVGQGIRDSFSEEVPVAVPGRKAA